MCVPVKQLSSSHQLQHQSDVSVRLKNFLQLNLNQNSQKTSFTASFARCVYICLLPTQPDPREEVGDGWVGGFYLKIQSAILDC